MNPIFSGSISVFGDDVVFQGDDADGDRGAFIFRNGQVQTILDTGDILDGKEVLRAELGRDAIDGDDVALRVVFANGERAIYVATIPEPHISLALASGFVGLGWLGRRRLPR